MARNPTYEELERRVKDLEKESLELSQAEQALKSERDKLKIILNGLASANIGVDIVTANYEVLQQNQTLIDRFGDIVGKKCYKEYMSLEEPCSFCPMVMALENNRLERTELRAADGRDYELLAAPLTNPDGTVDKAIEVVQDITDRKRAEKELIFKENIISSSSSVIATCDLDGNMTYGNPSFLKRWGFDDAKEFLGKPFWEFWVVEDILDEIMQALQSEGRWFGEIKAKRKDGTLFDVQVSAATVYDIEGNPIALTSTSIDITDRKQIEKALRESEEQLTFALKGSQLGFWDWNIETGEVQRNERWAEMLGYSIQEVEFTVKQWADLIHADDRAVAWKSIQDHLEGRTTGHGVEYRMLCKDGKYKWILDRAMIVKRDPQGRPLRMSGTHLDITERKQAEEEREKLINELQEALKEIKTLRGILPLCSFCNKIRDDKGYWEQVDIYLHKYSEADISHSICPECAKKHYPDLDIYD